MVYSFLKCVVFGIEGKGRKEKQGDFFPFTVNSLIESYEKTSEHTIM